MKTAADTSIPAQYATRVLDQVKTKRERFNNWRGCGLVSIDLCRCGNAADNH
ncbi:hypothetical protein [Paraburkholderia aspalathi]|uniref:hypothetical protein n=1 Tax=Paraburkholderia aspalathi TaxID=1324617 RepID=UPI00190BF3B8|nr:hypothetical protein [Paraburkholderia aspalathi]MBK3823602.1 hypothetical protein [Paraburkholderia aspalathi]MBK3835441.1 hypothetical protein [Paraburkholderia aspalathi]MBK3865201.1 hypothetical protein [Paraburkholderia aspalathi]